MICDVLVGSAAEQLEERQLDLVSLVGELAEEIRTSLGQRRQIQRNEHLL